MSKDRVVTASKVSAGPKPGVIRIDSSRFSSAPCVTSTAFGRPVLPEVWMT